MEIYLHNVQGFRGRFRYTLDDYINIINSKHNGVGKTTLYDCIKYLCNTSLIEKEEHKYFLNLHETNGEFSVTVDGLTHGFILTANQPTLFFKQYEDEEREYSSENIQGVDQDIGILNINGSLINIFSKELNLFSSSASAKDYQLVKAITTHEETERVLELLDNSMEYNKLEVSQINNQLGLAKAKITNVPYYTELDKLESMLNDSAFEDLERMLISVNTKLSMMRPVIPLDVNSKIEKLAELEIVVSRLKEVPEYIPNETPLVMLDKLNQSVSRLEVNSKPVNSHALESVLALQESINKLEVADGVGHVPAQPLENLLNLNHNLKRLRSTETISANPAALHSLILIRTKINLMIDATNTTTKNNIEAENLRKGLQDMRVPCPIRKEVYLVDGICHY